MRPLGHYHKTPEERKRYIIDYTEWLDPDETLITLDITVEENTSTSPLNVSTNTISNDGKSIAFFAEGGEDGSEYTVDILANTSAGQTKEDYIIFIVEDV